MRRREVGDYVQDIRQAMGENKKENFTQRRIDAEVQKVSRKDA
jgi:hypothetical protein